MTSLIKGIHSLHARRYRWKPFRATALHGVWFVRHEHHFVFFRELSGGVIGVVTILYESMDLPARLKEDENFADDP